MRRSSALRCGAKTRNGTPCKAPAVVGKKRCRMHGGAAGSGAPKGNRNALKHGRYTAEQRELDTYVRDLIRVGKEMIEKL
jgi:uncharacterized protein YjcR